MKQYNSSKLIRVMVVAAVLFSILSVAPSRVMAQICCAGVITYREGTQPQRIYAFVRPNDSAELYVNYWDGSPPWQWADQGTPPGTNVSAGIPGVITYREGTQPQRIYAFVLGQVFIGGVFKNHLYVNYWDGSSPWQWADQGTSPLSDGPMAPTDPIPQACLFARGGRDDSSVGQRSDGHDALLQGEAHG